MKINKEEAERQFKSMSCFMIKQLPVDENVKKMFPDYTGEVRLYSEEQIKLLLDVIYSTKINDGVPKR